VNRNYVVETLKNEENDNGKLSDVFGRVDRAFCIFLCELPNVKMGKTGKRGGGGRSGIEREEKIVKNVGFPTFFPQNSPLFPTLYGSALR
jgi:hypothetical protein